LVHPHAQASHPQADFLHLIDRPRVALTPEVSPRSKRGRFSMEHFTFASEAHERVPGILLAPSSGDGRRPAVVVLHGTGDSKEGMLPLLEDLADRGFVAIAIDGRHHGEREAGPDAYDRAILQAYRGNGTHPLLYDTVWDSMRLIDYLQTRAEVDATRIGMLGISKGGMETYLTAAVDPRVAVAVPVIAVQSFKWALEHDRWQARVDTFQGAIDAAAREAGLRRPDAAFVRAFYDRVVPGIYTEFDGPSMLPLIAPRPLLAINGDSDGRTPMPGVQECAEATERAYKTSGVPDRFRLLVQPGAGHVFTPRAQQVALEWLVTWLRP
jgi:dienelactone hydrolase